MKEQQVDISLLNYFKDLYNGHKIIYVRFLDTEFIFKTLTRKEYKYIISTNTEKMDIEDAICNTACIFPEEYDFTTCGFAGLNEYVSSIIEEQSGFTNINFVLNEYNHYKEISNLEIQCMDLIKAFIPEYTYEEMEDWTWSKLMQMTVRAEKVALLKGFDWKIEDKSSEYMDRIKDINIENKEFIEELEKNNIDPMLYFADDLQNINKKQIIDFPIIGGIHWNDEVILNVIREQIRKKKHI